MKHVVHKAFYDFEKEEKWLNTMSAKGLAFCDYSWCRYVFDEAPKNEFIYRLEMLEQLPKHAESVAYIRFLEENGVECVSMYWRWIYLRKKTSEGPFDIYTDNESKIEHFKRILLYWTILMWLELSIGLLNLGIGILNIFFDNMGSFPAVNVLSGLGLIALGMFFYKMGSPVRKEIKRLEREKLIME